MFKNRGVNIPGENVLVGNFPGKIQKGGGGRNLRCGNFLEGFFLTSYTLVFHK